MHAAQFCAGLLGGLRKCGVYSGFGAGRCKICVVSAHGAYKMFERFIMVCIIRGMAVQDLKMTSAAYAEFMDAVRVV